MRQRVETSVNWYILWSHSTQFSDFATKISFPAPSLHKMGIFRKAQKQSFTPADWIGTRLLVISIIGGSLETLMIIQHKVIISALGGSISETPEKNHLQSVVSTVWSDIAELNYESQIQCWTTLNKHRILGLIFTKFWIKIGFCQLLILNRETANNCWNNCALMEVAVI